MALFISNNLKKQIAPMAFGVMIHAMSKKPSKMRLAFNMAAAVIFIPVPLVPSFIFFGTLAWHDYTLIRKSMTKHEKKQQVTHALAAPRLLGPEHARPAHPEAHRPTILQTHSQHPVIWSDAAPISPPDQGHSPAPLS